MVTRYRGYLRLHGTVHGRRGRLRGAAVGIGFSSRWDGGRLFLGACGLRRALCIPAVPLIRLQIHEQHYSVNHEQKKEMI